MPHQFSFVFLVSLLFWSLALTGCQTAVTTPDLPFGGGNSQPSPAASSFQGDPSLRDHLPRSSEEKDALHRRNNAKEGECVENAYPGDKEMAGKSYRLVWRKTEINGGWCEGAPGCKKKKFIKEEWEPCVK